MQDWPAFAAAAAFDAILGGGLLGYGFYADENGPIISGVGWVVANIPRHYYRFSIRRMPGWAFSLGVLGGLAIVTGFALSVSSHHPQILPN